jgi:beta-N-acetylhexosaminidase
MRSSQSNSSTKRRNNHRNHIPRVTATLIGVCLIALTLIWVSYRLYKPASSGTEVISVSSSPSSAEDPFPSQLTTPTAPILLATPSMAVSKTPTQMDFSAINNQVASMSLAQKAGQMILMGLGGEILTPEECQTIQQVMPGGIVFHGDNVSNPDQLRHLISDIKSCAVTTSGIPLFFAIDHEGQFINRFESGMMTLFPSAQALGATNNPDYAYQVAFASGQELSSAGINMVLGPVADVLTNYDNTVIGERSFGSDPQQVGLFVAQSVRGYREAGLISVLKHFPGHGGTSIDSHQSLPVDTASPDLLSKIYFPPFFQGLNAGSPVVMMGHIALPHIDSTNMPASLSPLIVDTLRDQLGFDGVVITDALNMGALQSTGLDFPGVVLASVGAGVDILLVLSPLDAQIASYRIQQAVEQGEFPIERVDDSARRILKLKEQNNLLNGYHTEIEPNWQLDQTIAYDAGYHSVAVLRNSDNLVPIPVDVKNILIIAPPNVPELPPVVDTALQVKGYITQFFYYPDPQRGVVGDDVLISDFAYRSSNADLTIILTWQAHSNRIRYNDDWQGRLVATLQQRTPRLIVAGLKSSTDLLEFQNISTFISTFGTTEGQLQALADILVGNQNALGVNPLQQLP